MKKVIVIACVFCVLSFGFLAVVKIFGANAIVDAVMPPDARLLNIESKMRTTNEKGRFDMSWYFTGRLANAGGSGNVTLVAEIYGVNNNLWYRKKKTVYVEGDTVQGVEMYVSDIKLSDGMPDEVRFYVGD